MFCQRLAVKALADRSRVIGRCPWPKPYPTNRRPADGSTLGDMGFASPPSVVRLAAEIASEPSEETRWRLLLGFLDEFQQADSVDHAESLRGEPDLIGDARWDVMVAAVAEHLAYLDGIPAPHWVRHPGREWAGSVWWVVPLPSARPWALAHSPASFRRRGIFLHPDDLAVA